MRSVKNPDKVVFSAGAQMWVGPAGSEVGNPYDPDSGDLIAVGLLGEGITFGVEQTFREKLDRFPEVVVARAIQRQGATLEAILREWTDETIRLGLGLHPTDVEAVEATGTGATATPARREYPIGRVARTREFTISLREELTNGGIAEVILWRAHIGINGNMNFNTVDTGGDVPISVSGLFDPEQNEVARLRDWEPTDQEAA